MPESSISEWCAICRRPITTNVTIDRPFGADGKWTVMLCEAHGAKVLEMVTDYYIKEHIKHERTPERFGRAGEAR